MTEHEERPRAIVLLSGGLDSALAAYLIKRQGVEVVALNMVVPFGNEKDDYATNVAREIGVRMVRYEVDISEYMGIVRHPRHGYGANMNPCIDCHAYMLQLARKLMHELGGSFVVTGDVLGERPMSQHRKALQEEEEASGLEGVVLRPLSARLLPQTIPEQEGWVARENLLGIRGRSRRPQLELAREFGLSRLRFATSGCLLTYREFATKLKGLLGCRSEVTKRDLFLLRIGRHFYHGGSMIIVGRNEKENKMLLELLTYDDYYFEVPGCGSPVTVLEGAKDDEAVSLAARLTARYSDATSQQVTVICHSKGLAKEIVVNLQPDFLG